MTASRYIEIRLDHDPLSKEEIKAGWHFCRLAGGDLIGPGMDGFGWCDCMEPDVCRCEGRGPGLNAPTGQ